MRKIEQQMTAAVQNDSNWQSANTAVVFNAEENTSTVYLHGNKICTIGDTWMQLWDGGHQSKTTKSRLNALLSAFGVDGERVFAKDFDWYLQQEGGPVPFFSGMRLA